MITETDIDEIVAAGRRLSPTASSYLEEDFVMNLLETVLDYMLQTTVVVAALEYFRANRWNDIRTLDNLDRVLERYPEDQQGNTALAVHLWGYRFLDARATAARPRPLLPQHRRHRPRELEGVGARE